MSTISRSPALMRRRAKSIPFKIKEAIRARPCTVCGSPYSINVDHIVPVASGGTSELTNLQPLCHACNHIKGCRLSNKQIAEVVRKRGLSHFEEAIYQEATRFYNRYDKPSCQAWMTGSPDRAVRAKALLDAFVERWRRA